MNFKFNLGIIGYGNMANAIIQGILRSNTCTKEDLLIYDNSSEKIGIAKDKGFNTAESISDIALKCKYILLSVKPQSSDSVFNELKGKTSENIIISIMAGISKENIHKYLNNIKVCRCMPNTPALIGKGMTAIDASETNTRDKQFVLNVFSSVGNVLELKEKYMNAVTAVSGSGPAYVYLFINSFIEGACELGLTFEQAKLLVLSTVNGSADMIKSCSDDIQTLIDRVCSKGGTTIEGVKVMQENNIKDMMVKCVAAANKRAEELSKL